MAKQTNTKTASATAAENLSVQAPVADAPLATATAAPAADAPVADAPIEGALVELTPEELAAVRRRKAYLGALGDMVSGESLSQFGGRTAAALCMQVATSSEWTELHASKLTGELRGFYDATKAYLEARDYSKPAVAWMRIRKYAAEAYEAMAKAEREKALAESGQQPAVTKGESKADKCRRLCEEDIQAMYSRIQKAEDCDRDIMNLLPELRKMAKAIGYELREVEVK